MNDFLKPGQVCQLLNVSYDTVLRWLHRGQLKACRLHGRWRVRRLDALALLTEPQTAGMMERTRDPATLAGLRRHKLA